MASSVCTLFFGRQSFISTISTLSLLRPQYFYFSDLGTYTRTRFTYTHIKHNVYRSSWNAQVAGFPPICSNPIRRHRLGYLCLWGFPSSFQRTISSDPQQISLTNKPCRHIALLSLSVWPQSSLCFTTSSPSHSPIWQLPTTTGPSSRSTSLASYSGSQLWELLLPCATLSSTSPSTSSSARSRRDLYWLLMDILELCLALLQYLVSTCASPLPATCHHY